MKVDIQVQDFTVTNGIREAVLNACDSFLRHHGELISQVSVHMADTNGLKGGVDKFCRVAVSLRRGPIVVSSQVSDDLYLSIRQAFARAGRGTGARVGRRRNRFAKMKRRFQRSADYGMA